MTARPYANLLPERFRQPFYNVQRVVALCFLIGLVLEYLAAIPSPWKQGVQNLFFFMLGLDYLVWPNDGGLSPLASRVIGGGLVAVLLFSLITYVRHL